MKTAKQLPMISVVIPVYNTERYLEECVASVYRQEYEPKEVILVDDGSTDGSARLCDRLAEEYGLKVIHKENGGGASARNAGIREATGKYIVFLDSDDMWIGGPQVLENIIMRLDQTGGKSHFLMFGYTLFHDAGETRNRWKTTAYNLDLNKIPDKAYKFYALIARGMIHVSACFKLIDLSFFRENRLYFSESMGDVEDAEWAMRLFGCAEDFCVSDDVLYAYRQNVAGSSISTYTPHKFYTILNIIDDVTEKYYARAAGDKLAYCFMAYACTMLCGMVANLRRCERKYHAGCIREIAARNYLCNFALHPNALKTCRMISIIGISATSRLLHFYMKYRRKTR